MPVHTMHAATCSHYCGYCMYSAICTVVATTSNSAPNETNVMYFYLAYRHKNTHILSAMRAWPDPGKWSYINCLYFSSLGTNKGHQKTSGGCVMLIHTYIPALLPRTLCTCKTFDGIVRQVSTPAATQYKELYQVYICSAHLLYISNKLRA